MGQKHKRFRESRTPFLLRDIRKNPRSRYARVPQAMAQFVLKIEKLSHIMVPTPILEMARAYGLRPIQSVIILVINKLDTRCAVVRFCYRSYDYRLNWTPLSPITITNSDRSMAI